MACGAKEKPCPVYQTEQGNGINTHHKILYSCGYHITAAGERQEEHDTERNYGIR